MRQDPAYWHPRYLRQAAWTQAIRRQAWALAGIRSAGKVLEVGSGTGVILADLLTSTQAARIGLDLDLPALRFHRDHDPSARLCAGNGLALPLAAASCDVVLCHFLLLWVTDALAVVREMMRVVRPGGWVLCLAEPDYGGRIDYPDSLAAIGGLQRRALQRQGAQPDMGRRLRALIADAGLESVEAGVLGAEWSGVPDPDEWALEWSVLRRDLQGLLPEADLQRAEADDRSASFADRRVLYVPTFYAFGRKPSPRTA